MVVLASIIASILSCFFSSFLREKTAFTFFNSILFVLGALTAQLFFSCPDNGIVWFLNIISWILLYTCVCTDIAEKIIFIHLCWLGVLIHIVINYHAFMSVIFASVVAFSICEAIRFGWFYLTGREGLGSGDASFCAFIASWVGLKIFFYSFWMASIIGSLIGLFIISLYRQKNLNSVALPFVPLLYIGLLSSKSLFFVTFLNKIFIL